MRGSSLRCAAFAVALAAAGCFPTDTEVITSSDAVKLCGDYFVHNDADAHEKTLYRWQEARKAYIDPEQKMAVRFARLKGDIYLLQAASMERAGQELLVMGYMLALVRVTSPPLAFKLLNCADDESNTEALAREHGVTVDRKRERLTGRRDQLLGFLGTNLAGDVVGERCERLALDATVITPQAFLPGRAELLGAGPKKPLTPEERATGSISGLVYDTNDRPLFSEATVTATNMATKAETRCLTHGRGVYSIGRLAPGQYQITVAAEHPEYHRPFEQQGITIRAGDRLSLDVTLELLEPKR